MKTELEMRDEGGREVEQYVEEMKNVKKLIAFYYSRLQLDRSKASC